ncbi:MFS transporter [Chloroflexota bacterium]
MKLKKQSAIDFNQKRARVFYGWYIVGACLLISLYTTGFVNLGFTAVFEPIAEEFGWSYAQISLGASLRGLEVGLLAPVVGLVVDRWGPRRLIFGGSLILCAGFLFLSRVSSLTMFYVAFAVIAIGMSTTTQTVTMTAVGNWFRQKIGMATGIVASGVGLGGILVPVLTGLIDLVQWRNAMLLVGLGMIITVLPLSLVLRHKPEHYGYQPDGDVSNTIKTKQVQISMASAEISISAKQALKTRTFWNVAFASMIFMCVSSALLTHIMPYLSTLGVARSASSLVALVLPVLSVVGRLVSGWLSDKLSRKYIFVTSFALMSVSLFLFDYVTSARMWLFVPATITFSLGWGSFATTRIALQREYFGRESFGTVFGFTSGIMMAGTIAGAPLAGWVFDTWSSYQGVWLIAGAIAILGMVLALTIPSYSSSIRLSDPPIAQQNPK